MKRQRTSRTSGGRGSAGLRAAENKQDIRQQWTSRESGYGRYQAGRTPNNLITYLYRHIDI